LHVGLRGAEIATLTVADPHQNRGFNALRLTRKGCRCDALAINPQAAVRIRAYLDSARQGDDQAGPLFRQMRSNPKAHNPTSKLIPSAGNLHQHGTEKQRSVGGRLENSWPL
jgi:site-specific recombinase XerD